MRAHETRPALRGFLPAAAALFLLWGGTAARGEVSGVSYRESPESFSWELVWDGRVSGRPEDVTPARDDPDDRELWTPGLRVSRSPQRPHVARLVFEARHNGRVHELDAPQGPVFRSVLFLGRPAAGPSEWTRLDGRQLIHLATPKDHPDAFDVLYRVDSDAEGRGLYRFVFQAAHGPASRAKKAAKGKKRAKKLG